MTGGDAGRGWISAVRHSDRVWPELTKRPSDTHKETKQEHHAALRKAAGGVRSGLNPSLFFDIACSAPHT